MSYDCRNCGASIKNNVSKCNYCGVSLPIRDHQDATEKETPYFLEKFQEKNIVSKSETETETEKKSELIQDSQKQDPKIFFKCRCSSCNSVVSFDSDDALSTYSWDSVSYWVISCPVCGETLDIDKNNKIRIKSKKIKKTKSSRSIFSSIFKDISNTIADIIISLGSLCILVALVIWLYSYGLENKLKDQQEINNQIDTHNYNGASIRRVSLKICNETINDIVLAVIEWDEFNEDWYTSGWSEVKNNSCSIIRTIKAERGIYWYAKNKDKTNPMFWEGEITSCVSDDPFKEKYLRDKNCDFGQKKVGFKFLNLIDSEDIHEERLVGR